MNEENLLQNTQESEIDVYPLVCLRDVWLCVSCLRCAVSCFKKIKEIDYE